jgi:hypothetical protein
MVKYVILPEQAIMEQRFQDIAKGPIFVDLVYPELYRAAGQRRALEGVATLLQLIIYDNDSGKSQMGPIELLAYRLAVPRLVRALIDDEKDAETVIAEFNKLFD